jgi:Asp-tRNA(Asn)/Glu-tRNA(Gln) amidotransferase A subunit family amidase
VQLVGRSGDEATLLALSSQLETDTGWPARRPPPAA